MATVATPYGLKPINLIGGQAFNGGVIREYKVAANNSAAIFNGDLVVLSSAGQPSAVSATPVAFKIPTTSSDATAGIMGVCVGARYINNQGQPTYNNYLPANTITGGGSDVFVLVMDDPDAVFQIKGSEALGTFNSGTAGLTTTGVSGMNLLVGTNGAGLVTTATYAVRIVDVVRGTESEDYPEFLVKLNIGVHSYYNSLGV